PLNVSRELLQQNRQLERSKASCTKRVLDLIEGLARNEPEKVATLIKACGNSLKEGIGEDTANRERIAKLLRFASTKGDDASRSVSLDDYIARMPEGQDTIWYVTGETHAAAAGSPQLEAFKARDTEVLLMSDRIDEWMLGYLHEYEGQKLQSVAKGELPLDDAAKQKHEEAAKAAEPLVARDRKSTRLNSSHVKISYAVFCLKKKKKHHK